MFRNLFNRRDIFTEAPPESVMGSALGSTGSGLEPSGAGSL